MDNLAFVPTFDPEDPSDVSVVELPASSPSLPNPADAVMQCQREWRNRLVLVQHAQGEPIRNRPQPPPPVIKMLRKLLKRRKRGLPLTPPKPHEPINTSPST